jgi:hypothetical protein
VPAIRTGRLDRQERRRPLRQSRSPRPRRNEVIVHVRWTGRRPGEPSPPCLAMFHVKHSRRRVRWSSFGHNADLREPRTSVSAGSTGLIAQTREPYRGSASGAVRTPPPRPSSTTKPSEASGWAARRVIGTGAPAGASAGALAHHTRERPRPGGEPGRSSANPLQLAGRRPLALRHRARAASAVGQRRAAQSTDGSPPEASTASLRVVQDRPRPYTPRVDPLVGCPPSWSIARPAQRAGHRWVPYLPRSAPLLRRCSR